LESDSSLLEQLEVDPAINLPNSIDQPDAADVPIPAFADSPKLEVLSWRSTSGFRGWWRKCKVGEKFLHPAPFALMGSSGTMAV